MWFPVVRPVWAAGLIAAFLTGCASSNANRAHHYAGADQTVHRAAMAVPAKPYVELEDDGLPVQMAPLRRQITGEDDHTEPFSPNYGPAPYRPSPRDAERLQDRTYETDISYEPDHGETDAAPRDAARDQSFRRLTEDEAARVLIQAIEAHERRYP